MDLRTYLREQGLTQTQFAKRVEVSIVVISNLCCGRKKYSDELCQLISAETGGMVPINDLTAPRPTYQICPTCKHRRKVR